MKDREIDLLKLGFTLKSISYSLHKYGNTYWVDAWTTEEDTDEEWEQRIKSIKEDLIKSKKIQETEELFLLGFSAKQKQTDKIILDLLNKHRSSISFEETTSYKAYIEVLTELRNKLK
jgi:hypothetical protein